MGLSFSLYLMSVNFVCSFLTTFAGYGSDLELEVAKLPSRGAMSRWVMILVLELLSLLLLYIQLNNSPSFGIPGVILCNCEDLGILAVRGVMGCDVSFEAGYIVLGSVLSMSARTASLTPPVLLDCMQHQWAGCLACPELPVVLQLPVFQIS